MSNPDQRYELSDEEWAALDRFIIMDKSLAGVSGFKKLNGRGRTLVRLDSARREAVRTSLTELLAKIGFNDDYSLTADGQLLENLIDRFQSK